MGGVRIGWIRFGVAWCLWTFGAAWADDPIYRVYVDGLACPFCAYGVEKKLGQIAGVERVETNIAAGVVTVSVREGVSLDEATARTAVQAAGFTLRRFERIGDPDP